MELFKHIPDEFLQTILHATHHYRNDLVFDVDIDTQYVQATMIAERDRCADIIVMIQDELASRKIVSHGNKTQTVDKV